MNDNYPNIAGGMAMEAACKAARDDVTVRQNIDAKIANLKQMIADLEATKDELGPLMDMRIDRLRRAMNGGIY